MDRYYEFSHIVDLSVKVADYIGATPETVYFANGSLAVLSSIFFKVFTERPKHMLGIGPQFVQAISEWRLSGGTYDAVPMDVAGDLDGTVEQLVERIKREAPTLVYLDNPNNPTGRVFTVVPAPSL